MQRIRKHFDRELILLFLLSAFALAPLASPGYFFGAHDADHSVFFLVEFDQALRDGALWPRWGPDHALGYGYPLWLLYAPLAYYAAEGFHLLGLGFTAAVKAAWAVGFLFGGWGMALLLRRWFGRGPAGRAAALVGGLLYVYAPYHLLTIYVRAAFAEFSALAWFPWVLLAFDAVASPAPLPSPAEEEEAVLPARPPREGPGLRGVALAGLAYGGLLLTHSGTILVFTPLLLAYLLFALLRRGVQNGWQWADLGRAVLRLAAGGLLGIGLAAIFLLPMLLEQRYILQEQWVQGSYGYRGHFVYLSQLLDPFWGYGYSDDLAGPNDGLSFQLGIAGVVLALAAAVTGLRRGRPQRGVVGFFLVATLASLALLLPLARPLWDAVGPAALIQFPWRLLGLASLGLAILGGAAVAAWLWPPVDRATERAEAAAQAPAAAMVGLAVALASLTFALPEYTAITPVDESALSIIRFETTYPEMIGRTIYTEQAFDDTPLVAQYRAGEPLQRAVWLTGRGEISSTAAGASVTAQVNTTEPGVVLFYTYDFPGWRATVDGQPVPHRTEPPYGLIAVEVPAGQHEVAIRHGTTPARSAGALVSALSLAAIAALYLRPPRPAQPGETPG
jgi:hypothetical protein